MEEVKTITTSKQKMIILSSLDDTIDTIIDVTTPTTTSSKKRQRQDDDNNKSSMKKKKKKATFQGIVLASAQKNKSRNNNNNNLLPTKSSNNNVVRSVEEILDDDDDDDSSHDDHAIMMISKNNNTIKDQSIDIRKTRLTTTEEAVIPRTKINHRSDVKITTNDHFHQDSKTSSHNKKKMLLVNNNKKTKNNQSLLKLSDSSSSTSSSLIMSFDDKKQMIDTATTLLSFNKKTKDEVNYNKRRRRIILNDNDNIDNTNDPLLSSLSQHPLHMKTKKDDIIKIEKKQNNKNNKSSSTSSCYQNDDDDDIIQISTRNKKQVTYPKQQLQKQHEQQRPTSKENKSSCSSSRRRILQEDDSDTSSSSSNLVKEVKKNEFNKGITTMKKKSSSFKLSLSSCDDSFHTRKQHDDEYLRDQQDTQGDETTPKHWYESSSSDFSNRNNKKMPAHISNAKMDITTSKYQKQKEKMSSKRAVVEVKSKSKNDKEKLTKSKLRNYNDQDNNLLSSSDSSEIDLNESLEIPYAQDFDGSQMIYQSLLTDTKKEPLRPGDIIMYDNPMYVATTKQAVRVTQVLQTRRNLNDIDDDDTFPLELANGEYIPGDTQIRRIREYLNGKLYPHSGLYKPISMFTYQNATLDSKHGDDGLQRQIQKIQQIIYSTKHEIENNNFHIDNDDNDDTKSTNNRDDDDTDSDESDIDTINRKKRMIPNTTNDDDDDDIMASLDDIGKELIRQIEEGESNKTTEEKTSQKQQTLLPTTTNNDAPTTTTTKTKRMVVANILDSNNYKLLKSTAKSPLRRRSNETTTSPSCQHHTNTDTDDSNKRNRCHNKKRIDNNDQDSTIRDDNTPSLHYKSLDLTIYSSSSHVHKNRNNGRMDSQEQKQDSCNHYSDVHNSSCGSSSSFVLKKGLFSVTKKTNNISKKTLMSETTTRCSPKLRETVEEVESPIVDGNINAISISKVTNKGIVIKKKDSVTSQQEMNRCCDTTLIEKNLEDKSNVTKTKIRNNLMDDLDDSDDDSMLGDPTWDRLINSSIHEERKETKQQQPLSKKSRMKFSSSSLRSSNDVIHTTETVGRRIKGKDNILREKSTCSPILESTSRNKSSQSNITSGLHAKKEIKSFLFSQESVESDSSYQAEEKRRQEYRMEFNMLATTSVTANKNYRSTTEDNNTKPRDQQVRLRKQNIMPSSQNSNASSIFHPKELEDDSSCGGEYGSFAYGNADNLDDDSGVLYSSSYNKNKQVKRPKSQQQASTTNNNKSNINSEYYSSSIASSYSSLTSNNGQPLKPWKEEEGQKENNAVVNNTNDKDSPENKRTKGYRRPSNGLLRPLQLGPTIMTSKKGQYRR